MNALPKIDMKEATRLTREGRLRGGDGRPARSAPQRSPVRRPVRFEGDARQRPARATPRILDMVPPSPGTGRLWTPPQSSETPSAGRPGAHEPAADP